MWIMLCQETLRPGEMPAVSLDSDPLVWHIEQTFTPTRLPPWNRTLV